jgi:DNA-binding NarL/FixJ family response regulator
MREAEPELAHHPPSDTRATVMIVDDHPLVREGLIAGISAQTDMVVCAVAADVEEALTLIGAVKPDVVIVDIALKNGFGLDLIKKVIAAGIRTHMLVVSAYEESLFAERALRAGARGYVSKQELQEKVIDAIRVVLRGERYVSAAMTQHLIARALDVDRSRDRAATLSERELQVFQLIGRGKKTREIAQLLNVSVHTIESHREHIRMKLRLSNGTELVQQAVQWQIENH